MMKLGICNELFEGWDFARVCHTVKSIGYDGLEIAPFTLAPKITDLPAWRFAVPRGGLCLWARLERPGAEALADAAAREGVHVVAGPTFGVDGTLDRHLRLPFTQPPDRLEEAVRRLAAAERRVRPVSA